MEIIKLRVDLYKLLPENPVVCEVGVAEGYFSHHMAHYWKAKKIYCVDNWGHLPGTTGDGNFPQEWHNMNYACAVWRMYPFKDKTEFLRGPSDYMARYVPDNSLDLLYLDGSHSYEGVKKDLDAWFYKVKTGGIIAGHDFLNPAYGVNKAVIEFAKAGNFFVNTIEEKKIEDAGFYFTKTH